MVSYPYMVTQEPVSSCQACMTESDDGFPFVFMVMQGISPASPLEWMNSRMSQW
jgi:hypothetical protein